MEKRIQITTVLILFILAACNSTPPPLKENHKVVDDGFYHDKTSYKKFDQAFIDSLESFFPSNFSGTVLFYRKGFLFKKAIGYRDADRKEKMELSDVFQLASVSKTVTAVAIMQLHEKKILDLDSAVRVYLEDFPYRDVTVRQLLNHRSGLPNYMYFQDSFCDDPETCMSNQDLYTYILAKQPNPYLPPNHSFSYCNTNYALLATLLEMLTQMEFNAYVEKNIFQPAGMSHSFYYGHQPKRIKAKVMVGRYEKMEYNDPYFMDGILGDKSLFSNVDDLFLFHLALAEGRLLSKQSLKQMEKASFKHNVYGGSYGLGFRLLKTETGQWTYHNGWWRGFWTSFWNRFDDKTCMVILTNNKFSSHISKAPLADFLYKSK